VTQRRFSSGTLFRIIAAFTLGIRAIGGTGEKQ
jgi:hypothetical protein